MDLKGRIEDLSASIYDELIVIRRHLHAHPELSFEEFETAKYLESVLDAWGIEHYRVAETGVVCTCSTVSFICLLGAVFVFFINS